MNIWVEHAKGSGEYKMEIKSFVSDRIIDLKVVGIMTIAVVVLAIELLKEILSSKRKYKN